MYEIEYQTKLLELLERIAVALENMDYNKVWYPVDTLDGQITNSEQMNIPDMVDQQWR